MFWGHIFRLLISEVYSIFPLVMHKGTGKSVVKKLNGRDEDGIMRSFRGPFLCPTASLRSSFHFSSDGGVHVL
jgi:hypothetical protein